MQITSSSFQDKTRIPQKYTCDVDNPVSPPLSISDVPDEAKSLALIVDDPDAPGSTPFTHWIVFNIPPDTSVISEGALFGTTGANTRGDTDYTSPCPPSGPEPSEHRYFFKLYALDTMLNLQQGVPKEDLIAAMQEHIIDEAELMGTYSRA